MSDDLDELQGLIDRLHKGVPVLDGYATGDVLIEAADALEALRDEVIALQSDAMRYHHLRDRISPHEACYLGVPENATDAQFDAAIDAAIQSTAAGGGMGSI